MALNEALQHTPQYFEQIGHLVSLFTLIAPPIIGITLKKAAETKANILGNNLKKEEVNDLRGQAFEAQNALKNAEAYGEEVTVKMINEAGLAQVVLTKLAAAERRKEEKEKKP